jgi:hypothetical protein
MGADGFGLRWTTAVKLGNEAYTGSPERVRIFSVPTSTISTLPEKKNNNTESFEKAPIV